MNKDICYSDLILLTNSVEQNIRKLVNYGADKIELLMDGVEWDEMDSQIEKMKKVVKNYNIKFMVHPPAWDINLTSENKAIRDTSFEEYKRSILFAHEIEAEHVVIHPGFCFSPIFDKAIARKRAEEYIGRLCQVAKPLGVKLAIENVGYNGTSIFTEDEFAAFLDETDDIAGYLIDTGHAHLNQWNIPEMIRCTNSRLFGVHIHDNSGDRDDHLPIGEGTLDWRPIFNELENVNPNCQLILEYAPGTKLEKLTESKQLMLEKGLIFH
ncbi:sugar phosphate isomerase/epimerase [Scopulibacillus daqui]|uniref:Sugar phosphate isomerase/epimerase n=1 Tax=Scopulibacillus daqui TaxID=1469162 RepID=A0ABS2Q174_9BACL|nr:sugar phosphate isomerase/epimerase family protein [Scopulibacillus daqui]MBM7646029.1 sugar phosphate isomerase/epimerase [Scopulibacillus daqui]